MTTPPNARSDARTPAHQKKFGRRSWLRTAGVGGMSLAAMTAATNEDQIA